MEYPNTDIDKVKEDLWKMWKSAKQMIRTKEKWKPKQTMTKEKWRLQHFDTLGHRCAIAPLTEYENLIQHTNMQMTHFDVIYFFCHITCLQENSKTSPVIQSDVFSLYVQV